MDTDTIVAFVGLGVAGLAAVVGIWVERDHAKPPRYAYALSILILLATFVSMVQTYLDAQQGEQLQSDMARMLQMMDKIASNSEVEIPELSQFVAGEMAIQSRANPKVVQKLAQRVADDGEDPAAVLSRNLPASDVEGIQRKGTLNVKPVAAGLAMARADGSAKRPLLRVRPRAPAGDAPPEGAPDVAAPAASAAAPAGSAAEVKAPVEVPKGLSLGGLAAGAKAAPSGAGAVKAPAAPVERPKMPALKPKP